ncbi:thioredoxin family protein [Thalassotalea sp. LPB0316]|uniref:thioredoxin family protein n=1 Tax=Thalassotalea sp. LPB0316 TaxID=2769490 RepID=UPI001867DB43|nr:thioredoxin family protein [Thalassotalea sp. LPB0316]QOL26221.1 thioredoxin family protein [Thalassotalea sp. LPB0316]
MKFVVSVLLALALVTSTQVLASSLQHTLPQYSKQFDDTRDPFKDAIHAINLAKETNRNILIKIGGEWCGWCHKMDKFLKDNPDIYAQLHNNFVLLKVNVSDTNENAEFMKGLPPVEGYPHMYVTTATGKMLLSKDTAEFLDDEEYSRTQWLTFIENWQPTGAKAIAIQAGH